MGKRLKKYLEYMSGLNTETMTAEEREKLKQELLIQIAFFQHERLIHLIVTMTFAVLAILTFLAVAAAEMYSLWILFALFIVLLVPYIAHYYKLENGVQKLYEYYDKLAK